MVLNNMFDFFSAFKGLVKIGGWISKFFHDKQLMDAGENKAKARQGHAQINRINIGLSAGRNVSHDADRVRNDKANRNNR